MLGVVGLFRFLLQDDLLPQFQLFLHVVLFVLNGFVERLHNTVSLLYLVAFVVLEHFAALHVNLDAVERPLLVKPVLLPVPLLNQLLSGVKLALHVGDLVVHLLVLPLEVLDAALNHLLSVFNLLQLLLVVDHLLTQH